MNLLNILMITHQTKNPQTKCLRAFVEICKSLGGPDGTRTRDLCRDRAAF